MLTNTSAIDRRCLQNVKLKALSDVRVVERDLEFSFGGLNYSYSLFSYKISIEIIRRRPWF